MPYAVWINDFRKYHHQLKASSFTIAASNDPEKNSRFFDCISEEIKFLKIEAAASGNNGYCLYSFLA